MGGECGVLVVAGERDTNTVSGSKQKKKKKKKENGSAAHNSRRKH